jgi:hypothetical protein
MMSTRAIIGGVSLAVVTLGLVTGSWHTGHPPEVTAAGQPCKQVCTFQPQQNGPPVFSMTTDTCTMQGQWVGPNPCTVDLQYYINAPPQAPEILIFIKAGCGQFQTTNLGGVIAGGGGESEGHVNMLQSLAWVSGCSCEVYPSLRGNIPLPAGMTGEATCTFR